MGLFKQQQSQRPFTQQRACDACPLRLGSVHATGLEPAAKGAVLPPGSIACQGRSVCWPRHGPANLAVIGFEFRSAWLLRGCRQFWPRAWRSHLAPSPRKTDPCRPSGCRPGGGRCFLIGLAGAEGGGAGLVEVRGGSAVRGARGVAMPSCGAVSAVAFRLGRRPARLERPREFGSGGWAGEKSAEHKSFCRFSPRKKPNHEPHFGGNLPPSWNLSGPAKPLQSGGAEDKQEKNQPKKTFLLAFFPEKAEHEPQSGENLPPSWNLFGPVKPLQSPEWGSGGWAGGNAAKNRKSRNEGEAFPPTPLSEGRELRRPADGGPLRGPRGAPPFAFPFLPSESRALSLPDKAARGAAPA